MTSTVTLISDRLGRHREALNRIEEQERLAQELYDAVQGELKAAHAEQKALMATLALDDSAACRAVAELSRRINELGNEKAEMERQYAEQKRLGDEQEQIAFAELMDRLCGLERFERR